MKRLALCATVLWDCLTIKKNATVCWGCLQIKQNATVWWREGGEGRERRWLHTVAKSLCLVENVEVLEEDREGILSKIVRKRGRARRGFREKQLDKMNLYRKGILLTEVSGFMVRGVRTSFRSCPDFCSAVFGLSFGGVRMYFWRCPDLWQVVSGLAVGGVGSYYRRCP